MYTIICLVDCEYPAGEVLFRSDSYGEVRQAWQKLHKKYKISGVRFNLD